MQAIWVARRVERWLQETQTGRVHSRFQSVLNLGWGEHLITIALPDGGRLPGGILLDPATFFRAWPGEQGDLVTYDPASQVLRLPGGPIALGDAAREGAEPAPLARIESGRLKQNLATLVRLTGVRGKGELAPLLGAQPPADLTAWPQELSLLAGALIAGEGSALVAAASPLLGRGHGLTPAWDDLLLGLLAITWFAGPALPVQVNQASKILAEVLAQAAPTRTTAISASYLSLAADGGWSERLADAVIALLSKSGPALVAPIQRLLAFGHSSGHDTAVGLALGGFVVSYLLEGKSA